LTLGLVLQRGFEPLSCHLWGVFPLNY